MMTLQLPMPHPACSPNGRAHWATKSRYTKAARSAARMLATDALNRNGAIQGPYTLSWEWRGPTPMDLDNAEGRCKAIRDGIADALGINDREFINGERKWTVTGKRGCRGRKADETVVVVTLTERKEA